MLPLWMQRQFRFINDKHSIVLRNKRYERAKEENLLFAGGKSFNWSHIGTRGMFVHVSKKDLPGALLKKEVFAAIREKLIYGVQKSPQSLEGLLIRVFILIKCLR